jgi:ribosomal protein S18 acetylase RimI-like enzyme
VFALRLADLDDLPALLPRTRALNAHEGIRVGDADLELALRRLLGDPSLGAAWLVERDGAAIGYLIVTYGYDLEFAGRDAWLTELWIDEPYRNRGAGSAALAHLPGELRTRDVRAVHLQVRPDNPALRAYLRAGFTTSPRLVLTRRLD